MSSHYIVGKTYLIECVLVYKSRISMPSVWPDWIPIFGSLHEDTEHINFPHDHWHIDWRFAPKLLMDYKRSTHGHLPHFEFAAVITTKYTIGEPAFFKRKCLRKMPDYMPSGQVRWLAKLENAYEGTRITKCGNCPHRGLPLTNIPPDKDGNVVCRGHGLKFSLATRKMIRQTPEACKS